MRPRVAFLGVGGMGLDRLRVVVEDDAVDVVGIADPSPEALAAAGAVAPGASAARDLEGLLDRQPDGVVVATPSGQHAAQCLRVLHRGAAVFCQSPLGCDVTEVEAVITAARRADRLLGMDLSYRHRAATRAIEGLVRTGGIGRVYAADLVLHDTCGPGGGCILHLGAHLVDLALWLLDDPDVVAVRSSRWARGRRLDHGPYEDEDHAMAEIELEGGGVVRLSCSTRLPAGQEARVAVDLWGTEGAASVHEVGGSSDAWGGRAAVAWCRQLAEGAGFDPSADRYLRVAEVIDDLYATS